MNEVNQEDDMTEVRDELAVLKERAALMGMSFHPSISVAKLRDKINAALQDSEEPEEDSAPIEQETLAQAHSRLRKEASALIRVRLTCMNPAKQKWEGEIITVSNSVMGTMKKFIPFHAEDGWHIPKAILNVLLERTYQAPYMDKGPKGQKIRKYKLAKEFSIEHLPNLTPSELQDLANQQAIANRIG